jgi:DNA mismatch repair protein MutS
LDRTKTAMGGRLIRNWLEQPLTDPEKINFRLDGVEELFGKTNIRDDLAKDLKHIYDMERLSGKAVFGTANARDLLSLNNSFKKLPELKVNAANLEAAIFRRITQDIDSLDDISSYLYQAIIQDPPVGIREGGLIRDGFDPEVDRLKRIQREGRQMLADLEMEERENSGIKSLKIGYNKVFGYYLEVTKSYINLVPDYFIRKQTLANAERYITPKLKEMEELILSSEDRLVQLEYNLFVQIREKVATAIERIQKTSRAVAILDALLSLSEVALEENYIRPRISNSGEMSIVEGRHPVVEKVIGIGEFVPNDTLFNDENKIILLTGPNMAGKSTYMRQVALLVLMAQIGSFVPATKAQIGVVDKIFTRIGAADDLAGGLSTFMVEMMECKSIVNGATETSLVIMDEVGRGTSTYDGISIARALVEYIIANLKCRTLFSTHYHELTDLDSIDGVRNYTVSAQEQDNKIIFLRKVLLGKADRSYGIHVAALAGLPEKILGRAQEILSVLENNKGTEVKIIEKDRESCGNISADQKRLIDEIARIDISGITPLEAMNFLAKMQLLVSGK